ncbi:Com family DNA-binding transcriptional regulator [Maridesulfovibrio ferrireducens]|nr:Com family DNA-binding transcriptional regulator [Maridesulfovibrio ferrireducens]
MIDHRCPVCGRLLMKGKVIEVQVKCPKCKKLVKLSCNKR